MLKKKKNRGQVKIEKPRFKKRVLGSLWTGSTNKEGTRWWELLRWERRIRKERMGKKMKKKNSGESAVKGWKVGYYYWWSVGVCSV